MDQKQLEAALTALEAKALALSENLEIRLSLVGFYEATGQDEKALMIYETILYKEPSYTAAQESYLQLKTRLLDAKE